MLQAHLFLATYKHQGEHSASFVVGMNSPPTDMGLTKPLAVWAAEARSALCRQRPFPYFLTELMLIHPSKGSTNSPFQRPLGMAPSLLCTHHRWAPSAPENTPLQNFHTALCS